jgi:iron complex transport system substrate-binding protein
VSGLRVRRGPQRIVCLTEEPTEILYRLGEGDRVVGISAYTVRPPEAAEQKPVVSAFIGGSVKKIAALRPDLVIGFSDIQADLARDLIAANLPVLIFNQRSLQEILDVIVDLGRLVDARERAEQMVAGFIERIETIQAETSRRAVRPRVYFEEWDDPMICGIQWVSELIEIAGGRDVFAEKARGRHAADRTICAEDIAAAVPDVMVGCWCGKPLDRDAVLTRPGLADVPAIANGRLVEMPPEIILQPGPACLTDGLDRLVEILAEDGGSAAHGRPG